MKQEEDKDVIIAKSKQGELTLKAKGAMLAVLIAVCLIGIIWLALKVADKEGLGPMTMPMLSLFFLACYLSSLLAAVLGFTRDD